MVRRGLRFGTSAALLLALGMIVPAAAQMAPPSRDGGDPGRAPPHYVDNADYDPQPYYVDGVQYKPYQPDAKKKAKADAAKGKPAADTTKTAPTPTYVDQQPQTDLHPYAQHPASSSAVAQAADSSSPAVTGRGAAHASSSASDSSSDSASETGPLPRTRYAMAIIQALDKVTAETVRFQAPIGQPVRYKGLIYLVRACETTASDEPMQDVMAYMQVRTNPANVPNAPLIKSKEIFHGWTFASSPAINPLEHTNYDAWVIACRNPLPGSAQQQGG